MIFPTSRAIAIAGLVMAGTFATACTVDSTAPRIVPIEETSFASALGVNLSTSTKTANGVYYRDITVGTGGIAVNGQTLNVRYTGWLSNGAQFDSNVGGTSPYPFVLGTGNVIAGWHDGLQGVRVGGKRQLIIPAALGYGPYGNGPIPGNAVIVFNVEVISAQ